MVERLNSSKRQIAKSFKLKPSKPIGLLQKDGFKIPNDLESYYPSDVWAHALAQGWLEDADIAQRLSAERITAHLRGLTDYMDGLDEAGKTRVLYRWKKSCKETAADYICALPEEQAKIALRDIAHALKGCIEHLYPNSN